MMLQSSDGKKQAEEEKTQEVINHFREKKKKGIF